MSGNESPYGSVQKTSITALAPTIDRRRKIRSGTSGAGWRDSISTKATSRAAGPAKRPGGWAGPRAAGGGAGKDAERVRRAPAGGRRLDERVDEQTERSGDRERAGRVVASPSHAAPALAQAPRRQRARSGAAPAG